VILLSILPFFILSQKLKFAIAYPKPSFQIQTSTIIELAQNGIFPRGRASHSRVLASSIK
jgi:hypothetical protein